MPLSASEKEMFDKLIAEFPLNVRNHDDMVASGAPEAMIRGLLNRMKQKARARAQAVRDRATARIAELA